MQNFILFLCSEELGVDLKEKNKNKRKLDKVASLSAIKVPQQLQLPQVTTNEQVMMYTVIILLLSLSVYSGINLISGYPWYELVRN